ncbi:MAG: YqhA family protein [Chloroflexota bacterium]|nr:YqhA family protein [Chloroflexota bacterium]
MSRLLSGTRFLVIVPVIGLTLAAGVFFVIGGFRLIELIVRGLLELAGLIAATPHHGEELPIEVEIVEYVHTFLIGTVLYITAVGLYQLFIEEIKFPGWLQIDSTEELETNLIGVTVVVLAVNFMGYVFTHDAAEMFYYGAAISLPIAALALFVGLRTWSTQISKSTEQAEIDWKLGKHEQAVELADESDDENRASND